MFELDLDDIDFEDEDDFLRNVRSAMEELDQLLLSESNPTQEPQEHFIKQVSGQ